MKQNISINILLSICISILGIVFSITWHSLQYFILTGFILSGFLIHSYHIVKIYKIQSYTSILAQCTAIKKSRYDSAVYTYYFKQENGETLTLKLNRHIHTIALNQKYVIYYEKDGSGLIKNYIGIDEDKEVV